MNAHTSALNETVYTPGIHFCRRHEQISKYHSQVSLDIGYHRQLYTEDGFARRLRPEWHGYTMANY